MVSLSSTINLQKVYYITKVAITGRKSYVIRSITSINISGRFRGGAGGTCPSGHPNSFDSMQFSGKFW